MRLNRLLEHRPARSRPVTALGVSLAALALSPLALAQAGETAEVIMADAPAEAVFGHAVIISPKAKLTSGFGKRPDPFTREKAWHQGTDIGAPEGTPVHTPGCGNVVFSGNKGGYGEVIEVAYADGTKMRFGQLSKRLVEKGDEVETGTIIGKVGMSGRATGPHLHLEYWRPAKDEVTGEEKYAPSDPQAAESLVLFAAG